ncbi:MAG: hypothetical protein H6869_11740 [Rhodospirillales bacterium]|nr:hypothetical protein [Rhodospirillales bacterium]
MGATHTYPGEAANEPPFALFIVADLPRTSTAAGGYGSFRALSTFMVQSSGSDLSPDVLECATTIKRFNVRDHEPGLL